MKNYRIRLRLFLSILILSFVPLGTAYFFLNETIDKALNLGFNENISEVLDLTQENLRTLRRIDPQNASQYQKQFQRTADLQLVYGNLDFFKDRVGGSLRVFFFIGVVCALLVSILAAAWISRQISIAYQNTLKNYLAEKEKTQYLEEVSLWQNIARSLAHEIKNPLTPIEMTITELNRGFKNNGERSLISSFESAYRVIIEEIGHLKHLVVSFTDFARLPLVKKESINLDQFFTQFSADYSKIWPSTCLELKISESLKTTEIFLDKMLFRQVISNLIQNAVEANSDRTIDFRIEAELIGNNFRVLFFNSGNPIPASSIGKIFNPYFTTKHLNVSNMGLGLAIVKKIIVDHGGQISVSNIDEGVQFEIILPTT